MARLPLRTFLNQVEKQIDRDIIQIATEAAQEGAEHIREAIRTTPSGLVPGKQNRIWSGHMLERVDTQVFKRGSVITVRAGWQTLKRSEDYFKMQDLGTGPVAFGMHAITGAQRTMEKKLKDKGIR